MRESISKVDRNLSAMGVGVTKFISKKEVRDRITREYPNPVEDLSSKIEVEHTSNEHSLLGQAFDYLTRIWLESQCSEVHDPYENQWDSDWTTQLSNTFYISRERTDSKKEYFKERKALKEAKSRADRKREQFLKTGMNVNDAIDAALVYSGLDHNIGLEAEDIESNSFEDDVVKELQKLFHLFREQDDLQNGSLIISPNFGERSFILEGHGDFIIDQTLVDVKTTQNPTFDPSYWRQLLSYYILNDIHRELIKQGVDSRGKEIPYPDLRSVGVYFARFGELKTINVKEYLSPREEYEEFRAWFIDLAIEENHNNQVNYDPFRYVLTDQYDFEDQTSLFEF